MIRKFREMLGVGARRDSDVFFGFGYRPVGFSVLSFGFGSLQF